MASRGEMTFGVAGAAGRMGQTLVRQIAEAEGCALAAATEAPGHSALGRDAGELAGLDPVGVAVTDDAAAMFGACEVVLDFTTPEATVAHARLAAKTGTILVAGTTGLTPDHQAALEESAHEAVIVWAPNMSVGVNLLLGLTERAAAALGEDFDVEIVEMHHRDKLDAPSGTALALGRAAANGRGVSLEDVQVRGRDGATGARRPGTIGFASVRGGDVVGDHSVIFAGQGERLELTHRAASRGIYALGAVRAALWARGRAPGLYAMADVLALG